MDRLIFNSIANSILQRVSAHFVQYGFDEEVASVACDLINRAVGQSVVTVNDIRNAMSRIKDVIAEKSTREGYYGSDRPRTVRLILRDKVFFSRSSAISEFLEEVM